MPVPQPPRRPATPKRLPRVDEFSAGGIVVDRTTEPPRVAVIARRDRNGRLAWSLPKGHVEEGETVEAAAIREVAEETGITGRIINDLGSIDFWFVAPDRRVHKTVHHFLLEATGGELSADDVEVDDVAWISIDDLADRLAYPDERTLVQRARAYLAESA
jgi:ADP-ribose pyrophosphatase YjhB (NUDIX family)